MRKDNYLIDSAIMLFTLLCILTVDIIDVQYLQNQ